MGCDIHAVFQAKRGAQWDDVDSTFEEDRHYFLFSWLAGVRNGYGFAGVQTYTPVIPLAEPRGLPRDFDVRGDEHRGKWMGDHSHSWLTADEILAAKPPGTDVAGTGIITLAEYRDWDGNTPP